MKILHTADLHLSEQREQTLEGLNQLLSKAKELEVDYVTISGDLFDSEEDANKLRSKLRKVLSNHDFQIIAIPGNHDQNCYSNNRDFGSSIRIITNQPLELIDLSDDVSITAFPYTSRATTDLLMQLKQAKQADKTNILLIHCTLDIGYSSSDMGEEGEDEYFPITSSLLADLGYDYILAGHFHKDCLIRSISNMTTFVYPGSPTSITSKETGKRSVVLLDMEKKEPVSIFLDTFYHNELETMVYPHNLDEKTEYIKNWIEEHEGHNCKLKVSIKGFGKIPEKKFTGLLNKIIPENIELENEYLDISNVLEHTLFVRFKDLLNESDYENQEEIEKFAIEVFSDLLARRDID